MTEITVKNGWIQPSQVKVKDGIYVTELKNNDTRTLTQNRALHKYFILVAKALNDAGYEMRTFLKEGIEIPFTGASVKEYLWRVIQDAYLKKKSTTELDKKDIDTVYEIMNRALSTKGVHVPFPNKKTEL